MFSFHVKWFQLCMPFALMRKSSINYMRNIRNILLGFDQLALVFFWLFFIFIDVIAPKTLSTYWYRIKWKWNECYGYTSNRIIKYLCWVCFFCFVCFPLIFRYFSFYSLLGVFCETVKSTSNVIQYFTHFFVWCHYSQYTFFVDCFDCN